MGILWSIHHSRGNRRGYGVGLARRSRGELGGQIEWRLCGVRARAARARVGPPKRARRTAIDPVATLISERQQQQQQKVLRSCHPSSPSTPPDDLSHEIFLFPRTLKKCWQQSHSCRGTLDVCVGDHTARGYVYPGVDVARGRRGGATAPDRFTEQSRPASHTGGDLDFGGRHYAYRHGLVDAGFATSIPTTIPTATRRCPWYRSALEQDPVVRVPGRSVTTTIDRIVVATLADRNATVERSSSSVFARYDNRGTVSHRGARVRLARKQVVEVRCCFSSSSCAEVQQ